MEKEVYSFIKKNGRVSRNVFGFKFAKFPNAGVALENLIKEGYIRSDNDLFSITEKPFKN